MPHALHRSLAAVDYAVLATYFAVVIGIGWVLRRTVRTSTVMTVFGAAAA